DGIREQIEKYDKAVADGTLPEPPKLWINPEVKDFFKFDNSRDLKDIRLEGYENLGTIKMPISA
ncbi:thymidylate synthase, partial [Candidatus Saccharibacteria bacterium]|nr:thymidylate synthase [Candidatus Saccharibacteria bacterium]MBQ6355117.1 thymidylate synthase [Candidatus Saccharibacteria bacterium]